MVYYTPLEVALERELGRIGMPFTRRTLIQDEVFEEFFRRQATDYDKAIEQHIRLAQKYGARPELLRKYFDPKVVPWHIHNYLLFRTTKDEMERDQGDLVLDYFVEPSDENIRILKSITDYDQLRDEVEKILAERRFSCEGLELEKVMVGEEENLQRILIGFYPHRMDRTGGIHVIKQDLGVDAPRDIFKGIVSPIQQADLIAERISNFIKNK